MAQIMKYWNYPAQGTGSFTYVDDNNHGYTLNIGTLSANFGATSYQWTQMPNYLTGNNAAIALLMSHCGISVAMNYTDAGSGAIVLQAEAGSLTAPCAQHSYITYFSYNPNTIQGVFQANYTGTQWINLIENEMNEGRVVQYQGYDPYAGGHTWVCDGYDVNNNLHMNWGWGGPYNGYYAATNLSAGGYTFSGDDAALIGIEPLHPVVDTTCSVAASFAYQNTGGSNIQFTNNSTSNPAHAFTSAWKFYNAAGQFATSTLANPLVTFTGQSPYSATLVIVDTFYGGCRDSVNLPIDFNPNTVCITLQQGATAATGAELQGFTPTQNFDYTTVADFVSSHWTHGGTPTEARGLLQFNFSQIPAGSVIVSAHLSLYADTNSVYDVSGQPMYGPDNASNLYLVTSAWNPATVDWNTQPTVSTTSPVLLAQSTVTDEDYLNLDISSYVQGWVANPANNYGMMLEMIGNSSLNSMIFCSPGYALPARWPKLEVCYIPPVTCQAHASFVQQNLGAGQVRFTNTSADNIPFTSQWIFRNGTGVFNTSTQTSPTVTFTGPTPYSATLVITDSICSDTLTQVVDIVNCLTLQTGPTAATGAELQDFTPAQNFDFTTVADFVSSHWTHGGTPTEARGLLQYDLSQIPVGSVIISANLSLWADTNSPYDIVGQPMYGTNNASNLYLVTSDWNPATVNWNSMPAVSTNSPVLLPQSTATDENYFNIDISGFVQAWVNNPANNYGIMLEMITQNHYNTMIFCSPGYADSTKWPKLDICYQQASPCQLVASFTQQDVTNAQVQFTNTSTYNANTITSWHFFNGNGLFTTSTLNNPLITFGGPPPFSALLQIEDTATFCTDTVSEPIIINGCTTLDSFTYVNLGNGNVQFINQSVSSNGFICNWTFYNANGQIGTSTLLNPVETFTGPQTYYALLDIRDSLSRSCIDTLGKVIKITTTGINEPNGDAGDLFIFPNPNNGNLFNVHLPLGYDVQTTQVKVFDMTGREIKMGSMERAAGILKLSFSESIAAGIYTLTVFDNSAQQSAKLVIVK